MCFGLPVLASDKVGATGDLVASGVNGEVYTVGDVDALAGHMRALARDPALRARYGDASRARVARWSYVEDVEGIVATLRAVVRRSA
jgi:glycosyltransferase involved in cell wall biosynthesis